MAWLGIEHLLRAPARILPPSSAGLHPTSPPSSLAATTFQRAQESRVALPPPAPGSRDTPDRGSWTSVSSNDVIVEIFFCGQAIQSWNELEEDELSGRLKSGTTQDCKTPRSSLICVRSVTRAGPRSHPPQSLLHGSPVTNPSCEGGSRSDLYPTKGWRVRSKP